jgi:hypothetical protein
MEFEQPVRDVSPVIGVDADQVGVEGGIMMWTPIVRQPELFSKV